MPNAHSAHRVFDGFKSRLEPADSVRLATAGCCSEVNGLVSGEPIASPTKTNGSAALGAAPRL
jgi:hypothetical protein